MNAIQQQQPNSNGLALPIQQQKPSHVGDGLGGGVSVVAVNDNEEQRSSESVTPHLRSPSSSSSDSSSSLNGENENELGFINGSRQLPKQPVDNVESTGLTTASTATASISAALVPPSPTVITASPITPTPASMSFMSHQRRHPSQSDPTSTLEATPPSDSSNTPISKEGESVDGEGENAKQRGTKITIPDSALSSNNTSSNSNPTSSSRPTSTSIDTALYSNRPAPPSPALSRRVSGAPSIASSTHSSNSNPQRSPTSRRPSMGMSRASLRMSGVGSDAKRQSLGIQLSQFMDGGGDLGGGGSMTPTASSSPLGSPHKLSFTHTQPSSSSTQQATSSTTTEPSIIPTLPSSPVSDPIPTPTITPTTTTIFSPPPQPTSSAHVYIKVRDFGFAPTDERHLGLGPDIPKANRVHRLNRKLGGPDRARARAAAAALDPSSSSGKAGSRRTDSIGSMASVDSSDADAEEEEEDGEDEGWGIGIGGWGKGENKGWDGFKLGMGRFSWTIGSSHSNIRHGNEASSDNNERGTTNEIFPSRKDLDMNFMDSSSSSSSDDERRGRAVEQAITEEFNDVDDDDFDESVRHTGDDEDADAEYEEDGEPQEPLYPGLYRALYAFEPEGTAEMKLDEDQIIRVVGRGGGVGWAVVVDERGWDGEEDGEEGGGRAQVKHALVPEGYLELVRLDWEEEEDSENEDGDAVVVEAGDVEGI